MNKEITIAIIMLVMLVYGV